MSSKGEGRSLKDRKQKAESRRQKAERIIYFYCLLPSAFYFLLLHFALRTSFMAFAAPELDLSLQTGGSYNDHIEFGLSIDPSTSALSGREDPQLAGFINQNMAQIQLRQSLSQKLSVSAEYSPRSEVYIGENGKLDDQFSALAHNAKISLKYIPKPSLPPIEIAASTLSLNRRDPIYDTFEPEIEINLGQMLKYAYHRRDFKDKNPKEDYLLIGSSDHAITGKLQVDFTNSIVAKLEHIQEWENYDDNIGKLLLLFLQRREARNDIRTRPSLKLIQVLSLSFLLQEEVSLFFNNSDLEFYDFSSYAGGVSLFWRANDENWLRAKISQTFIKFSNRERGPNETDQRRRDRQFNLNLDGNWKLHKHISLAFNYLLAINRTNSTAPRIPEILDYTNNVISVAVRAKY